MIHIENGAGVYNIPIKYPLSIRDRKSFPMLELSVIKGEESELWVM